MSTTKMRVKVLSFDHRILEEAVKKIVQVIVRAGGKVVGPIPLRTKRKLITIPRSTFVSSKHSDKLESRVHKRLIQIEQVNPEIISNLSSLTLPAGVDINIIAI